MVTEEGMVVSGYGGFYQVRLNQGQIVDCKPRGRLKKHFSKIYTGDRVGVFLLDDGTGMIESIKERLSFLPRPNIVNVDRLIIVLSWKLPGYDLLLLDRMLVIAQKIGLEAIICFNKLDLRQAEEEEEFTTIKEAYEQAGFPVIALSTINNNGVDKLRALIANGITVMAGQSGVGKSSLLNCLIPTENAPVGEISDRLRRGKHTTRYTRILQIPDEEGFIADTPGFLVVELPDDFSKRELADYYPDFQLDEPCRFDGCIHDKEPDCMVKAAVKAGKIDSNRYQRYLRLLAEIQEKEVHYR